MSVCVWKRAKLKVLFQLWSNWTWNIKKISKFQMTAAVSNVRLFCWDKKHMQIRSKCRNITYAKSDSNARKFVFHVHRNGRGTGGEGFKHFERHSKERSYRTTLTSTTSFASMIAMPLVLTTYTRYKTLPLKMGRAVAPLPPCIREISHLSGLSQQSCMHTWHICCW